jgi:dodecin
MTAPVAMPWQFLDAAPLSLDNGVRREERTMSESVYRVTELVGTSTESWEKAATVAVETAAKSLRDLRIAEIAELDMQLEDGRVKAYRARVKVSFKYETGD